MAAAVIGTISITGGAVLGFLLDQTFNGTVLPLTIGFVVYGSIALALALWAERGTPERTEPHTA
jgi:DHA1 family bicyclomycin/chloramphenicol resistance-like MFS transporter